MEIRIDGMLHLRGVAPALLRRIKADNRFKNPKREVIMQHSARPELANHLPEKIPIYHESNGYIHIPRGYARILFHLDRRLFRLMQDYRTTAPVSIPPLSGIKFRDYQQRALDVIGVEKDQGIVEAPTGSGKTIIALGLMHLRGQRTMVLVHNRGLLNQWRAVIRAQLGLEPGIIGGGQWQEGAEVTVAMIQTLARRLPELKALGRQYGLLVVDEAHHVPAVSFGRVVNYLHCKFRYGLTATPHRRDGQHEMISRYVGPVLIAIQSEAVEAVGGTVPAGVEVVYAPGTYYDVEDWNELVKAIVENKERNTIITELAEQVSQAQPTLILVDRIAHVKALGDLLPDAVLMHGQLKDQERKAGMKAAQAAAVTVGTFNMLGEGLDIAQLGRTGVR